MAVSDLPLCKAERDQAIRIDDALKVKTVANSSARCYSFAPAHGDAYAMGLV